MIEQELRDDPYAQEAFSRLLRMAIEEAEKLFDHPLKQYLLFREFEEKVEARKLSDIPDALAVNKYAQAYYGVFKKSYLRFCGKRCSGAGEVDEASL